MSWDASGKNSPQGGAAVASTAGNPSSVCARCHLPMTHLGSDGECLRCVVRLAFWSDEAESDFTNPPDDSTEGQTLRYGQFEISVRTDGTPVELGSGGMATTYRARDTVLECDVALKVIDRRVAGHPRARARFLREARAAAKLHHPNIANVTQYGEQAGECYYAMELVEGETLEARVKREGPFSPAFALEVGVQVAHVLAAAEEATVVHRDLKPSNIMLTRCGNPDQASIRPTVKVVDWGLAKAASQESVLSAEQTFGGFVGTPAFASPEQLFSTAGTRLGTRSDIYSLGVTLWYLLCGRTPFVGETLDELHAKQIGRALPAEQLREHHVPGAIAALLHKMLAAEPEGRPQSARELLSQLEACQDSLTRVRRWRLARRWLAAAAIVALGLLTAALVRSAIQRRQALQAATDRSIAVLPFANLSPAPSDALFAAGIQDEVNSELAMIAQLKVIGAESVTGYATGNRDLARIARELGVRYLLEGSVRRSGDRAQADVDLVDLRDRTKDWKHHYTHSISDVAGMQRDITRDVANQLRATLSTGEKTSIEQAPTSDPLAYELYLRARQGSTLQEGPTEMRAVLQERLALLEQAVKRDPAFVDAYCEMAGIHDELAAQNASATVEERALDHRALAETALQKARSLKPDDGKVHLAQANHLLLAVGDNEQARVEAELARQTLPNNGTLEDVTAWIARRQGRWEDALRAAERAVELQPRNAAFLENLVLFNRALRRYQAADRASERLLAVQADNETFFERLLRALGPLEESADLNPLRSAIAAAHPTNPTEAAHLYASRLLLALNAHDPDAITRIVEEDPRPRIRRFGSVFPRRWFEGLAARMRGDESGARAAFTSARAEMERAIEANPAEPRLLSLLAVIDGALGRKEEAVREGMRAREMLSPKTSATGAPVVACNLAVMYAWTDQPDRAFAVLDDSVKHAAAISMMFQPTYGDLRLNPVWDPLRKDPRFAALVQKLAPHSR